MKPVNSMHQLLSFGGWLLLCGTVLVTFIPLTPEMPIAGLDPSWKFALNQAVAQGLAFGKQLVFTFGPYAAVQTESYHPATDFRMLGGSIYLALCYLGYLWLARPVTAYGLVLHGAVLVGLMYSRDALFLSLPLLLGIALFRLLFPVRSWLQRPVGMGVLVILLMPLGFLPLIKGSLGVLCVALWGWCSVALFAQGFRHLAVVAWVSPILSCVLFWGLAGQAVEDLPSYLLSMLPIISGYSEAMAENGDSYELLWYSASSLCILGSIVLLPIDKSAKIFLGGVYGLFLFVVFKAGFVRHTGHAVTAGTALLLATSLLPWVMTGRRWFLPLCMSAATWGYIDHNDADIDSAQWLNNAQATYRFAWKGMQQRLVDEKALPREFAATMRQLQNRAGFPVLQGSSDIYSYEQTLLLASGNTWSPRPIFQSYSVYTPSLADVNATHLLSAQAADNIFFRVEAIDKRFPALEDGASWRVLLHQYHPVSLVNDYLILQKNPSRSPLLPSAQKTALHHLGEWVNLPESALPIMASLVVTPTLLGRVTGFLFKPSQLRIHLTLVDGHTLQYRLIAGMAATPFLLSPAIENTVEFSMLYTQHSYLNNKWVKAIRIEAEESDSWLWQNDYVIMFSQLRS